MGKGVPQTRATRAQKKQPVLDPEHLADTDTAGVEFADTAPDAADEDTDATGPITVRRLTEDGTPMSPESDQEQNAELLGDIVTDKKQENPSVIETISSVAGEWAEDKAGLIEKMNVLQRGSDHKVKPGEERRDILKKAVTSSARAATDDHRTVVQKIKTFQSDAERLTGKPFMIQERSKKEPPRWAHILTDGNAGSAERKRAPAISRAGIVGTGAASGAPAVTTHAAPRTVQKRTPPPSTRSTTPETPSTQTWWQRLISPAVLRTLWLGLAGGGVALIAGALLIGIWRILPDDVSIPIPSIPGGDSATPSGADASVTLTGDRTTLFVALQQTLNATTETVSRVALTTTSGRPATAASFFSAIESRAPSALIRSFRDTLEIGGVRANNLVHPYLVLKTDSFDATFAGMLEWEPFISGDLAPLFGEPVTRSADPDARTADGTVSPRFVDRAIDGINTRTLYGELGSTRLLYAFIGKNTLVLTTTPEAFAALLETL
jgi:hypothetical protein